MVLINAQTPRRAVRAHRVRADAVFPNQIAGTAVESLHRVAGVGKVDDPVVNDRSGLIRSTVIHGPRPFQTQTLYVAAGDLGERTITPRLVVAPDHQPVARIGMAKHLIGNRHVIFHYSSDVQPLRSGRRRLVHRRPAEGLAQRRRHLPRRDRADQRSGRRREGLTAGEGSVGLKNEGDEIDIGFLAKTAATPRWHRRLNQGKQIAGSAGAPGVHEIGARQSRRFIAASEVGEMAACATRPIDRLAGRGLLHRVRWRLCHDARGAASRQRGHRPDKIFF